ncbi:MAG: Shedu immune nuclease family protein [Acinetobacter sp.]
MTLFNKAYETQKDAPQALAWDTYEKIARPKYEKLLENVDNDEKVFQSFFEKNPSFLPGGLELIGNSGHYPIMHSLITQPKLGCTVERNPDFLWLAKDSLNFCPVFIEIEKPTKKMFTKSGIPAKDFNQAMNQIDEWKTLLNMPENQIHFLKYYNIPSSERKKRFAPQYLLVYGRRSEYEENEHLTRLRAQKESNDIKIMSFDRLHPISEYMQFVCCKLTKQTYTVVSIPPTFKYRADCSEELKKMSGFLECIPSIDDITEERAIFLKKRYDYWIDFANQQQKGMIISMEGE